MAEKNAPPTSHELQEISLQDGGHIDTDVEVAQHKKTDAVPLEDRIKQQHADLYLEALQKYGQDGTIDPVAEKRLKRKLDMRILPLLGICYFFVSRVTEFHSVVPSFTI